MTAQRDYLVTVCKVCRRASCWHGEFMCERAAGVDIIDVRASVLRSEVCGGVKYTT